jgi:response regulator RpfG family c-di-GMP phosphodiesterase
VEQQTVLFVDDEVNILKAVQRLFRNEPFRVLAASRAREALELLENESPQVVVTDQRMPEMSGVDLLSAVRERHPDVVRMMLTGYTEIDVAVEAINRGAIYRLITKPWNDEELKATIRQALEQHELKREIKRLNQVTREQNFKLQDMNRTLEAKVGDRTRQLADKHRQLKTGYIETIRALAEAVDAKDAYTRGHSERVGVYATKVAREMGMARERIERVYIAGLLRLHRRPAPRRRQDRRAGCRDHKARPPDGRGVRRDQGTSPHRSPDSGADFVPGRRGALRAPPP